MGIKWNYLSKSVLRMSGFPFQIMERFKFKKTHREIYKLFSIEDKIEQKKGKICIALSETVLCEKEDKMLFKKMQKKIWKKKKINPKFIKQLGEFEDIAAQIICWNRHLDEWTQQRQKIEQIFNNELLDKRKLLWTTFKDKEFLEAIFLNSPKAYEQIDHNIKKEWKDLERRTDRIFQKEKTLSKYLQRFCTKNETSSFFGPTYFSSLCPDEKTDYQFGQGQRLSKREVFVPHWVAREMAKNIIKDEKLQLYHRLQLHKYVVLQPGKIKRMDNLQENKIDLMEEKVLKVAKRHGTIMDIINQFKSDQIDMPESQALNLVYKLIEEKMIQYDLEIASNLFHPLPVLRERILTGYPKDLTVNYIQWCDEMEEVRKKLRDADFHGRIELQGQINQLYHRLDPVRRKRGRFYTDRHLFFEDTERNFEHLKLGKEIWSILDTDLKLVLNMYSIYRSMVRKKNYIGFKNWFQETFTSTEKVHIFDVMQKLILDEGYLKMDNLQGIQELELNLMEFIKKHKELVPAEYQLGGKVEISRLEVQKLVDQYSKYIDDNLAVSSVDYLISAKDIQAISEGDLELVIGELHPGTGALGIYSYFFSDIENLKTEILDILKKFYPDYQFVRGVKEHKNKTACMTRLPIKELEITGRSIQEDCLRIGDLYLSMDDDELRLIGPDGQKIKLFSHVKIPVLDLHCLGAFGELKFESEIKHTPRIQLGKIILQRASWELDKNELFQIEGQKYNHSSVDIYIQLLRAKEKFKLPNYLYYKGQNQRKPIFLDFDNYFLVEVLYSDCLEDEIFKMSEMLPDLEHLWIKDERGNYTSEFRHSVLGEMRSEEGNHV